jgi:hypothetical protein
MTARRLSSWVVVACVLTPTCGTASAAGGRWSVQWLPVPSSALTSTLSCSSSTACTAVAAYYPFPFSDQDVLLAIRWNGRGWSREVMPEPAGSATVLASGISCPAPTSCVAVGGSSPVDTPGRYVPLVEGWNGAAWSVEPVPAPRGNQLSSRLISVSCTSPIACTAVGQTVSRNSARRPRSLVERWNGRTWSIEPAPGGPLISVSCSSRLSCTAIGNTTHETLADGWDGSRWSIEPGPRPRPFGGSDGENELSSVACTARDACTAVGDSSWGSVSNSVRITLTERWNGSRWSVQPSPNPIQLDNFNSVSCSSGSSCAAVGDYTDRTGGATRSLVERWEHGRWSVLPTPRRLYRGRSADSTLLTVVCSAKGGCMAVGDAEGGPFSVEFAG